MLNANDRSFLSSRLNGIKREVENLDFAVHIDDVKDLAHAVRNLRVLCDNLQSWLAEKHVYGEDMPSVMDREIAFQLDRAKREKKGT